MRFICFLLFLVLGIGSAAFADAKYCNGQRVEYAGDHYYPNGQRVEYASDFYYPNGQRILYASDFYYPNGQRVKYAGDYFYPNGQRVKYAGDYFYPNGQRVKYAGDFFYPNGQRIKYSGDYFYPNGVKIETDQSRVRVAGNIDDLKFRGWLSLETGKLEAMTYSMNIDNIAIKFEIDLFSETILPVPHSFAFRVKEPGYLMLFKIASLNSTEPLSKPSEIDAICD